MGDRAERGLPPPAPPAERTAGQLVGESLRLYGRRFWRALVLGVPPTVAGGALAAFAGSGSSHTAQLLAVLGIGVPAVSASYVGASVIAAGRRPQRSLFVAFVVGVLVLLPVPFLATLPILRVLPAVAWFALFGLAVPVAVVEGAGVRESLARALELARADYIHALGSLAAAAVVCFVSALMLWYLLVQFGDTAGGVAALIALLLLSPVLLLTAAMLYFDQAARTAPKREGLMSPRARRSR